MNRSGKRFIIFIVFIVLGLGTALQFRSTMSSNKQKALTTLNIERLNEQIINEQQVEKYLKEQIEINVKNKEEFLRSYLESRKDDKLKNQWETVRLKAGLTDVEGPGIIITLDDAPARKVADPSFLIIHDSDIKIILNDLKQAGAQAISINGERISPVSEQVCAGPTIRINKSRYAVPYVIHVIGDPDILYESMTSSERIALMLRDNIRIDMKKSKNVFVPKFKNPERFISSLEVVKNEN